MERPYKQDTSDGRVQRERVAASERTEMTMEGTAARRVSAQERMVEPVVMTSSMRRMCLPCSSSE